MQLLDQLSTWYVQSIAVVRMAAPRAGTTYPACSCQAVFTCQPLLYYSFQMCISEARYLAVKPFLQKLSGFGPVLKRAGHSEKARA